MIRRQFIHALSAAALAAIVAAPSVQAQTYPERPIRLIAPFPAGGLADVLARAVGDEMSKTLGQPIIVENRAGAGGNTGAGEVARAKPDGYTLLMSSSGILTSNPHLYANMPFDPETAFAPISKVAEMPVVVVVHPDLQVKSLRELVAFAKANPRKLNFGSPGVGTGGHLGLAMLMYTAGIEITHIPYKGVAPAVKDLIAGQIDGSITNPPSLMAHINAGTLRPLAVASAKRMTQLPDIPSAAEEGVDGYEASSWFGLLAPAGTPDEIVERLHQAVAAAVKTPAFTGRFTKVGANMVGDSPKAFAANIAQERKRWGEVIKAAGLKPQ